MYGHDISEARLAARHGGEKTVVKVGRAEFGNGFTVAAGPCSVESEEQIMTVASLVKAAGAEVLRGGAFKPRTSPYDFPGLREEGIRLLLKAGDAVGLPVVTEIEDASTLPAFKDVPMLQVGARSMYNYELLRALGRDGRPVLLKRAPSASYGEFLMAAEYLLAEGNKNVVLCERGISTFETYTRATQDIAAIPALKGLTHLPVITDPSHASGKAELVPALSRAAAAAGADGIIVEVHTAPERARSDGTQALTPEEFSALVPEMRAIRSVLR